MRKLIVYSAATLSCFSPLAMADSSEWQLCHSASDNGYLAYVANPEQTATDLKADNAQLVDDGTSVFTGNVIVSRGGQELKANRATYNQVSGDITAQGDVRLRDSDMIIDGQQAEWSLTNDSGNLIDANFKLRENHARGTASHVHREGTAHTHLKNATYTTCSQGDDSWLLQSTSVNLDHQAGVGSARNVVVRLGGFPVAYTPYISFPLNDERKSGFLAPTIGNSDETGFDLQTPYYWNISPNYDATVTPRYMSERGLMLNGEFRYLYENGRGVVDAGYLGSDNLKNDGDDINPYFDQDRKHFTLKHSNKFMSRWSTNIDYNYVSDNAYLEDFSPGLSLASITHLNRELNVGYNGSNWDFTGRLQGYQTLTNVTAPYQRLPQLLLSGSLPDQFMGLTYSMNAEYVDFDHSDKITGQRVDIEPSISLPMATAAAFITPRVALHHTRYDLDRNVTIGGDTSPARTLPVVSVDSGLFFERDMTFAGAGYIHTLEPRAFYLYIPERNQSDIPVFDTSLNTFSMGQMFSHDRFSGADRVGDANQLTLALTSRVIDAQTGKENLRVSLGQIQYFEDREISFNNTPFDTRSDSDMVAEVVASIADEWTARGEIQWDPRDTRSNMSALELRYRNDDGLFFNAAHRYRRQNLADPYRKAASLEQVDLSTQIPFNQQWSVVGRWYRSLKDSRTMEGLAGVQYESCCWATRLVVRNFINDASDEDRNLAIYFQIELKGLGNFGQDIDSVLKKSILGYDS
ncbi:MAG: LPS assembly protein LptD [Gammaproteobacteria bacterium]|nr:LPS assembly protein LptD [Gammaproteobacteria bacterium]